MKGGNHMKRLVSLMCIFAILTVLLVGCGEPKISEGAEAVLNACMNTPNKDLFDPAMVSALGASEEDKAAAIAAKEQIDTNWENLLSQYFSPGSFDNFLNSYIRSFFHFGFAQTCSIESMTLVSKDDRLEVVEVKVNMDGTVNSFIISFHYNEDGLFYRVDMEEKRS